MAVRSARRMPQVIAGPRIPEIRDQGAAGGLRDVAPDEQRRPWKPSGIDGVEAVLRYSFSAARVAVGFHSAYRSGTSKLVLSRQVSALVSFLPNAEPSVIFDNPIGDVVVSIGTRMMR